MKTKEMLEYIEVSGVRYPVAYNLNVESELQERFGSLQEWNNRLTGKTEDGEEDKEGDVGTAIKTCQIMINEGIEIYNETGKCEEDVCSMQVSEKKAGRILSEVTFSGMADIIRKSRGEDGEEKNAEAPREMKK